MRFDSFAASYDLHAVSQRAFAARVAKFIRPEPGEAVLELGAGTGALTRCLLAWTAGPIKATDVSQAMLQLGRQAVPQAEWAELDAFSGSIPASSLQISSGLLQWAPEPARVLQAWKRALKPGGRMAHAFPCEPCLVEWRALAPESPLHWRDEGTWLRLFEQSGLRVRRRELWVKQFVFPSSLELPRAMHRSGVTGRPRLGAGRLRRVLRDYDARHSCSQGVASTWTWLAIEACASF